MDHLPVPRDAIENGRFVVPYVAKQYDGKEFLTYPERVDWPQAQDMEPQEHKSSMYFTILKRERMIKSHCRDEEVFLQTWLFFGMLHSFLEPFNLYDEEDYLEDAALWSEKSHRDTLVGVEHDDEFTSIGSQQGIQPTQIVHTKNLSRRLREWLQHITSTQPQERAERAQHWLKCLITARDVLGEGSHHGMMHADFNRAIRWSLAALGDALCTVYELAGLPDPDAICVALTYKVDVLAKEQMLIAGWCPNDIAMQRLTMNTIPGQYFAARLQPPNDQLDHKDCTDLECRHLTIDAANYRPQHTSNTCTCDLVGPDEDDVVRCLEQGAFPVIAISGTNTSDVNVEVKPWQDDLPYTAVSHVWADGLGNPHRSALPACQLLRIKRLINELPKSAHSHLWCDTICVPVVSDAANIEQKRRKALGVDKLYEVYSKATHVLVLDKSLEGFSLMRIGVLEAVFRMAISRWMRRVWCYQEGAVASRLYIQFGDSAIAYEVLLGVLCNDLADKSLHRHLVRDLATTLYAVRATFANRNKTGQILYQIAAAFERRGITVPSDEALCFANMVGLKNSSFTDYPDDEWMAQVWARLPSSVGGVPKSIIFADVARSSKRGYRWTPLTLRAWGLSMCLVRFPTHSEDDRHELEAAGIPAKLGLQVQYPAWRIEWNKLAPALELRMAWKDDAFHTLRLPDGSWMYVYDSSSQRSTDSLWSLLNDCSSDCYVVYRKQGMTTSESVAVDEYQEALLGIAPASDRPATVIETRLQLQLRRPAAMETLFLDRIYKTLPQLWRRYDVEARSGDASYSFQEWLQHVGLDPAQDAGTVGSMAGISEPDYLANFIIGSIAWELLGRVVVVVEAFGPDSTWTID